MANDQSDCNELLNRNPSKHSQLTNMANSKSSVFSLAFQINPAIIEHERSTSRSSVSSNSSIIDPGEDKPELSMDESSPNKRLCNEYNRLKINYDQRKADMIDQSDHSDEHSNGQSLDDKCKPLRSFLIKDILSHNSDNKDYAPNGNSKTESAGNRPPGFIRPWDSADQTTTNNYLTQLNMASSFIQSLQYNAAALSTLHPNHLALLHNSYHGALNNYRLMPNRRPRSADDDSRSERSESDSPESPVSTSAANVGVSSPLDALFEMTSKAFDRNENNDKSNDPSSDHLNLFNNRNTQIKKKRKSRTAFTNHQIFELEKRFIYQKYLSPADRDEIAQSLGLTNAQVITWFQNRRAKLKRDVEEIKRDVDAAKLNGVPTSILENIQDLNLLKKTDLVAALHHQHAAAAHHHHHQQQQQQQLAVAAATANANPGAL